jgi:hypothetical protein
VLGAIDLFALAKEDRFAAIDGKNSRNATGQLNDSSQS